MESSNLRLLTLFFVLVISNDVFGSELYHHDRQVLSTIDNPNFKVLAFAGPMRRNIGKIVSAATSYSSGILQGPHVQTNGFYEPYNPAPEDFYTDGSYKGEKIYWFKGKRIYW